MNRLWLAVLVGLMLPARADASGLVLHPDGPTMAAPLASGAVTDGRSGIAASVSTPGTLVVRSDHGTTRSYAMPGYCAPAAISRDSVALTCSVGVVRAPLIVSLPSGSITPVPVSDVVAGYMHIQTLGSRWLAVEQELPGPDANTSFYSYAELVNVRTGRLVSLAGEGYGPRKYPDLDAVHPARALCQPIRRSPNQNFGVIAGDEDKYGPIAVLGRWTLQNADPAAGGGGRVALERCGKPPVFFAATHGVVLGASAVAYINHRTIVVRMLDTGRVLSGAWPSGGFPPTLALTRSRLYVTSHPYDPAVQPAMWDAQIPNHG